MLRRSFALILVLTLLVPTAVLASPKNSDWKRLAKLKAGTPLKVELESGEVVLGDTSRITDDMIYLDAEVNRDHFGFLVPRTIPRRQVRRVVRTHHPVNLSRGAQHLIGTGAGIGVGLIWGGTYDATHRAGDDPGMGKLVGFILGALLGSAAGPAICKIPLRRDHVIYVAPPLRAERSAGAPTQNLTNEHLENSRDLE